MLGKLSSSAGPLLALTIALAGTATALPADEVARLNDLVKRYEPTIDHCLNDPIGDGQLEQPGNFYAYLSDDYATPYTCAEAFGVMGDPENPDGLGPVKTADGTYCFITNDDPDSLGEMTSCPGDPPPGEAPDGSPNPIAEGTLDAFCSVAGTGGLFGFLSFGTCYAWTFAKANGNDAEENKAGINLLCDTFTFGMCTCIESGACGLNAPDR